MGSRGKDENRMKDDAKPDRNDPLEDRTQPMSTRSDSEGAPPEDARDSTDTTTWGGSSSPPVIIEERSEDEVDDTLVVPSDSGSTPSEASSDADEMATVISAVPSSRSARTPLAPSSSLRPMLLERIEPSLGRGERLRLDAQHWRLSIGRAEQSDLRLYTASASRDHATIAGDEAGNWVLTPAEGKSVRIDGDLVSEPIVLEIGMNIVLGGDHLRCVTEGLKPAQAKARTSADGFDEQPKGPSGWRRLNLGWWAIALCALAGVGLILYSVVGG
jgi:hypothetical protein